MKYISLLGSLRRRAWALSTMLVLATANTVASAQTNNLPHGTMTLQSAIKRTCLLYTSDAADE